MAKIYKMSDRIKIKIGDVEFKLSPLNLDQKAEITEAMSKGRRGDTKSMIHGGRLLIKYSVKGVNGLQNQDGSAYSLNFENGILNDETSDELLNLDFAETLLMVCTNLVNKIPKEFTGIDGTKLEGVTFIKEESPEKNELTS